MFKLLVIFAGLAVANSSHRYFYRRDYTYKEEFDAFYKSHSDPEVQSWTDAFKACDDEGAQLFYPKNDSEKLLLNNLTDGLIINSDTILVGIRDQYGFGEFITVDGQPIDIPFNDGTGSEPRCVYMNIFNGQYNVESCLLNEVTTFICKKVDETRCPTIDLEYVYNKDVKKCYKVNKRQKTWQKAYHTCYLEGGMLAVVENDSEANEIRGITDNQEMYYVGFSRINDDYFTITGKRFEKVYKNWYRDEDHGSQCGAVWRYDGILFTRTVDCNTVLPFICEMNANILV